jgi:hypothetical protein
MQISMEEITWRVSAMKAITEAHLASPSHTKNRRVRTCEATPDIQTDTALRAGFVPEETQMSLPPAGRGIIPALPPNRGQDRAVSFQDTLADHTESDIIDSPLNPPTSRYERQQSAHTRAFQSPFKVSASRMSAREAIGKKDGSNEKRRKRGKTSS